MFRFHLVNAKPLYLRWENSQVSLYSDSILTRKTTFNEVVIESTDNEQFCARLKKLIECEDDDENQELEVTQAKPKVNWKLKVLLGIHTSSYNFTRDYIRVSGAHDGCILTRLEDVLNQLGFGLRISVSIQKFGRGSGQCNVVTQEVDASELSSDAKGKEGTQLYYSGKVERDSWEPQYHHSMGGTINISCVAFRKMFDGFSHLLPIPSTSLPEAKPYVFHKLMVEGLNSDAKIIASDGEEIKCHKLILRGQSEVFEAMFKNETKSKEFLTGTIYLDDICGNSVRAFLTFLYLDGIEDATENCTVALDVLRTAHKYNIPRLETKMREVLLAKPDKWFNTEMAIQLFIFSKNIPDGDDLMRKAAKVLKLNRSDLDDSPSYKKMFIEHPDAARDLCGCFVSLK